MKKKSQFIFLSKTANPSAILKFAYFYREKRSTLAEIVEQLQEREAAQVWRFVLCISSKYSVCKYSQCLFALYIQ